MDWLWRYCLCAFLFVAFIATIANAQEKDHGKTEAKEETRPKGGAATAEQSARNKNRQKKPKGKGHVVGNEKVSATDPLLTVTIAGVKHRLLFENANLPMRTQTTIARDIQHVFGDVFEPKIKEHEQICDRRSFFEKRHHLVRYRLQLLEHGKFLPKVLQDYFGSGLKHGNIYYLFIHTKMSDRYKEAIELKKKHAKKYKKLEEFLALMNDKESRQRAADTREKAQRFFHFHESKPTDDYDQYKRNLFVAPGASLTIRRLSMLDFMYDKEMDGLLSGVLMRSKDGPDEDEIVGKLPLVYSDNRWKILVGLVP